MKKILFSLVAILTLLSSCSSDDDNINIGADNTDPVKYSVNFNVKSTGFEVDKTPMKSLTDSRTFIQIVAYKESGEAYSDTIIMPEQISEILSEDGSFPFKLDLPGGNYHLAFIQKSYNKGGFYDYTPEKIKLKPNNFYTDTYGGGPLGYINNTSTCNNTDYYQTIEISVPNISQDSISNIVLEPMWSLVNIWIDDFIPLIGCNFVSVDVLPAYYHYSISTKLATNSIGTHFLGNGSPFQPVKQGVNNGTFYSALGISKTSLENNNMILHIIWYKDYNYNILMTTDIDLKTQVENGINYNIRGNCADILNTGSGSLNITYAPFNEDKPVDLPF